MPSFVLADDGSGACSDHGGVDCNAGANSDGSVICNDGWRDSSVNFYNVIECQQSADSCTPDELNSLYQKYGIADLEQQIADLEDSYNTANTATGHQPIPMEFITGQQKNLEEQENNKIQALQAEEATKLESAKQGCAALAVQRRHQEFMDKINQQQALSCEKYGSYAYLNATDNGCYCLQGYEWNSNQTSCIQTITCGDGFVKNGGQCIGATQDCQNTYG